MTAVIFAFLWGTGEFIFLGIFFMVLAIIVLTLITSTLRTIRIMKEKKADEVRWESEFHDLPSASRTCRHELTGEFKQRTCDNDFNCNTCTTHAMLVAHMAEDEAASTAAATAATAQATAGFAMPLDRMYHRGHTWVKAEADGTYTVGLDDFASRLVGTPESVELPEKGAHVHMNGTGWNFVKGGTSMRFLSPIEGEVVETSKGENGWFLRVKPAREVKTAHLLRGAEVSAWTEREIGRLQRLLADPTVGMTMADGGEAVKDITNEYPEKDWESIYSTLFLEP